MVPKKGLEPPHPCEYMDLNHARLPIPPLRHLCCARPNPALRREILFYFKGFAECVKPRSTPEQLGSVLISNQDMTGRRRGRLRSTLN